MRRSTIATRPPSARAHLQQDQPDGRAAARADRRAHAPRRARGELLVPPPPGRSTSGSPRACAGLRRRRHGLRRGLRLGRAGRARGRSVVGVDANPEAHEHARLQATRARTCASSATWSRRYARAVRRRRLPADDRARRRTRARCSSTSRAAAAAAASAYVSTPNLLTLAPDGRREVRQPVARAASTAPRSSARCCERALRRRRAARPLPRAQAARCTSWRCRLGWDRVHARARDHQAVLRPLHARRSRRATSRCGRGRARRARSTSLRASAGAR